MMESSRRFLLAHGKASCQYDCLTSDTLPNRIVKSTLLTLERTEGIDRELQKRVRSLRRDLSHIVEIRLDAQAFQKVQLHGNNRFYRFLLHVCKLVFDLSLPDPGSGSFRFRDFVRDERRMSTVFQKFLFNFMRRETSRWEVRREIIQWEKARSSADPQLLKLPRMETDISMSTDGLHRIIDAKYYTKTFAQRFDAEKVHSDNLYQMFAYLSNVQAGVGTTVDALLIYPQIEERVRLDYVLQGKAVGIATVNLAQPWEQIKSELLELVG